VVQFEGGVCALAALAVYIYGERWLTVR
jgi:hypothetical protein